MSQAGDYIDVLGLNSSTASIDSGDAGAGAVVYGSEVDLQGSAGYRYRRGLAWGGANCFHESATQSIQYALAMQQRAAQSGTGSTWAKYATASDPTAKTVTGTASGTTYQRVVGYYDFSGAARYVRTKLTPTTSTTATGTIYHWNSGIAMADINRLPSTG